MDENEEFFLFPEYGENKAITGQKEWAIRQQKDSALK